MPVKEAQFKIDIATGEKIPFSADEVKGLEELEIAAVYAQMGYEVHDRVHKIAIDTMQRGHKFVPGSPQALNEFARIKSIEARRVAIEEIKRRTEKASAETVDDDQRDRDRVAHNFQFALNARKSLMSAAELSAWEREEARCSANLAFARDQRDTNLIETYRAKLEDLGALMPDEQDLERWIPAVLEPKISPCGVNFQEHEADLKRLRAKYNLDENNQPIAGTSRRTTRRK